MYAVEATIQLSLAKNVAERIYSCFLSIPTSARVKVNFRTRQRTTTDPIKRLDTHAALVLYEILLEGEMVVRYGQTIINLHRIKERLIQH